MPFDSRPALEPDSVGHILLKAADYMRRHGWCQGNAQDLHGHVCALGSISLVITETKRLVPAADIPEADVAKYHEARVRLCLAVGDDFPHRWNDMKGRTQDEVIDALERAAFVEVKESANAV